MINFDEYYDEKPKEHNPDWPCTPDLPFRALIVGSTGTGKTNLLLNLIKRIMSNDSTIIDKIYLYVKDPDEPKYRHFINRRQKVGEEYGDPDGFIEVSSNLEDVYDIIEDYNPDKDKNILIVFDDMITEQNIPHKVTELFIRGRKLNISLAFITQSYFTVPKDVRLNCSHFHIMSLSNPREVGSVAGQCATGISRQDFMRYYNKCTSKMYNCLTIDNTLVSNDTLKYRHNFDGRLIRERR